MNSSAKIKGKVPFFLLILSTAVLFHESLSYYFFQDDWFVLNWARTGNLWSFLSFRTDVIYWRPISMPFFFALSKSVFGLNPFGFHIISFIFHCVNIFLVYSLFREFKFAKRISYFAAFIWGTAAFHFVPLSWLSTSSYIMGPTFIFTSIIFFIKSKIKLSLLFYILAMTTSEMFIVTIALIAISSTNIKKKIKPLLLFLIPIIPYLVIRFIVFSPPASGNYAFAFDKKVLENLFWYFAWLFNIAESFSSIFYLSSIKTVPWLFMQFPKFLIGPVFLIISLVILSLRTKPKTLIRGLSWFFIALLPFIFLPNHVYSMYLVIASLGPIFIFCSAIEQLKSFKIIIMSTISVAWFISSFSTVELLKSNYWVSNEQRVSHAYVTLIKLKVKDPPKQSIFLFINAEQNFMNKYNFTLTDNENTLSQSLNGDSAIQVIFNDSTLRSFYLKRGDLGLNIPKNSPVYEIWPKNNE